MAFLLLLVPLCAYGFNNSLPHFIYHPSFEWGNSQRIQETFVTTQAPVIGMLIICLLLCYAWLAYALHGLKSSKPAFVSRALAGFCLLDACFAAAFAPHIALICLGLFALALLFQRVTPAT
jgi:hypothetical protein